MGSEDKVWADGNQPATLIDGGKSSDFFTLGEAVIARAHLPEPQKSAATIKCGGRVFGAAEIDRLYHKPIEAEYDATLVDPHDHSRIYGSDVVRASSDDEAKAKSREWARGVATGEEALLILKGGNIYGSHSELIPA